MHKMKEGKTVFPTWLPHLEERDKHMGWYKYRATFNNHDILQMARVNNRAEQKRFHTGDFPGFSCLSDPQQAEGSTSPNPLQMPV